MRTELLEKINPGQEYFLNDVVDQGLIPGVRSYSALYNLITEKVPNLKRKLKTSRVLCKETGKGKLKAFHQGSSWATINGKIKVKGQEIIVFLKINGLLND